MENIEQLLSPLAYSFRTLLDSQPSENDIQAWLAKYPRVFGEDTGVLSKPFLGSEYELDFLLVANLTVGFSWTIVEIKSSDIALFRKDNKPAEALNAALYQVETYQAWIANHINYAREKYPNIYNPPGLIIIGRRHSLSDLHKQNLLHMNASRNIKIRTYDSFIDTLRFLNGLDFLAHNNKTTFLAKALQNLKNKFCYNPTNL